MKNLAVFFVFSLSLAACAVPTPIAIDMQESQMIPKQAALTHLRTLPPVQWPAVSAFATTCQYHDTGITDGRGTPPIAYEKWTFVRLAVLDMVRMYATVTNGENTMQGSNDCYILAIRPYQAAYHDAVVKKTVSALASLGARPYIPVSAQ